jgi:REP element-mobilizing transposase RayT
MAQDLSFESEEFCFFATTRTMNSLLWFINNPKLTERILAHLAKCQEVYGVIIYAFVVMGNHYHLIARFPRRNKANFFRDFNSIISKLTYRYVEKFEGGKLWARRVRTQVVPNPEDIKERFFYASLNPVAAGIVKNLSEYDSYVSFSDAVFDRRRKFSIVNWTDYNNRKRFNRSLKPKDCAREYTLTYSRLPGYEELTKSDYINVMSAELEKRRSEIVDARTKDGKGFASCEALKSLTPGVRPKSTKTSTRESKRPLVLTLCLETKKRFLDWYFSMLAAYKDASRRFRDGILDAPFPPGTFRPPHFCISQT